MTINNSLRSNGKQIINFTKKINLFRIIFNLTLLLFVCKRQIVPPMAKVAQLVEPRFVVPVVAGSSPVLRPRLNRLSLWRVFL